MLVIIVSLGGMKLPTYAHGGGGSQETMQRVIKQHVGLTVWCPGITWNERQGNICRGDVHKIDIFVSTK